MEQHDEEARRWARPGSPSAPADERRAATPPPVAPAAAPSPAAPWTRGARATREPEDASDALIGSVAVPQLPWEEPPAVDAEARREPRMWPVAAGIAALAVLGSIPHWVAPTVALMVSLVGIPIAWGFRRISHGRRRVQYIVVVMTLLLTAALAVIAPLVWLELGVLQPLRVPE
ncbi:hypothetical protein [Agrococcus beijingensis]|uniref:hypothetical protein n=1 Tax=Agrococcus beijingensis TaxID=3068634 RepID=UPI00274193BB|nr:hypothetical protein [Agrococcus sp. REN33]